MAATINAVFIGRITGPTIMDRDTIIVAIFTAAITDGIDLPLLWGENRSNSARTSVRGDFERVRQLPVPTARCGEDHVAASHDEG